MFIFYMLQLVDYELSYNKNIIPAIVVFLLLYQNTTKPLIES